jgi:hypothetical protein
MHNRRKQYCFNTTYKTNHKNKQFYFNAGTAFLLEVMFPEEKEV